MIGVLITLVFCLAAVGLGGLIVRDSDASFDPATRFGLRGLFGLGAVGWLTFFVGQIQGGTQWGLYLVAALGIAGAILLVRSRTSFGGMQVPKGLDLLFPLVLGIASMFALVSAVAPSDVLDWDTLAYHLAVPKIWIEAGRIIHIPFIHHSNFPFAVDNLFLWGLQWGGASGAKAFTLGFALLGLPLVFGIARQRYGDRAGWWAALAFLTVPVVLWETGSGYIDVAHGLFAGLGILIAASVVADPERRSALWIAGLALGFAAGSKYTGLQTIFAVGFVFTLAGVLRKDFASGLKGGALIAVVALAVASPWYARNVATSGNPVYPFFYERFGGENWDQRRADIYRNEQKTFGLGSSPDAIGHAMFGLAYQPGRYVNPGQQAGAGTPLGAVGIVVLAALLIWPLAGRIGKFEGAVIGAVAVSLLLWFALSQQSRYIVPLAVPLAVLAGGAATVLPLRTLMRALIAAQAAYTLYLVQTQRFSAQVQVVAGKVSPEEYQAAVVPFFAASKGLNTIVPKDGKVALYDEVFGFLLDVPYFWANPGHSTVIPYDDLSTGREYAESLKKLGFSHVYISLSPVVKEKAFAQRWLAAMGLAPGEPWTDSERQELLANWEAKYHVLIADAVRDGHLVPAESYRSGVLFALP